jgi:hypothetical protein
MAERPPVTSSFDNAGAQEVGKTHRFDRQPIAPPALGETRRSPRQRKCAAAFANESHENRRIASKKVARFTAESEVNRHRKRPLSPPKATTFANAKPVRADPALGKLYVRGAKWQGDT